MCVYIRRVHRVFFSLDRNAPVLNVRALCARSPFCNDPYERCAAAVWYA